MTILCTPLAGAGVQRARTCSALAACALLLVCCAAPPSNALDSIDATGAPRDAGSPAGVDARGDAATLVDAGEAPDSNVSDSGLGLDAAAPPDAHFPVDASSIDAAPMVDAAPPPPPAIQMVDVTAAAGIVTAHGISPLDYHVMGQAFGDFDGDGWVDLYLTSSAGPNHLYRNLGDGTFALVVAPILELANLESGGATFVDFDNDGDKDLYVLNNGPNRLFRNDAGIFVDHTSGSGLGDFGRGETAAWGDYDGDSYLDVYIVNSRCLECAGDPELPFEGQMDRLYRNLGNGSFADVSSLLEDSLRSGMGFSASFLDYDSDGDLDLYVNNDRGLVGNNTYPLRRNVLWRNDGPSMDGWHFEEVAIQTGADLRIDAMGLAVGDVDNDGDLDLAVTDTNPVRLLRNTAGHFSSEPLGIPVDRPFPIAWGVVFVDFDNDGWLDLHAAATNGTNQIFHNQNGNLVENSLQTGAADPGPTMGLAYADYDHDGRVDLIMGNRGQGYRLYRNVSAPLGGSAANGWLDVELTGGGPVNRDAVGARVRVFRSDGAVLMQEIKCGDSLGAGSELALHFGLGQASIAAVIVTWPDGTITSLGAVAANQRLAITYP